MLSAKSHAPAAAPLKQGQPFPNWMSKSVPNAIPSIQENRNISTPREE